MDTSLPPDPALEQAARAQRMARMRWWAAVVITLGMMLHAVVRNIVVRMAGSRFEPLTLALLGLSIGAALALTAGLRPRLPDGYKRLGRVFIFLAWAACCGVGLAFVTDNQLPKAVVSLLFVAGTLWAPWLGWQLFDRQTLSRRLLEGAAVAAGFVLLAGLLKVDAMRGDTTISFAWRWAKPRDFQMPAPVASAEAVLVGFETTPDDFPGYLGPQRTGVLERPAEFGIDWVAHPPRELWRQPVGPGWSGFATRGDYAFTQEQRGESEYVVCRRIVDGEILWSAANRARFESPMGGAGPRAVPAIAEDGRIYTVGGAGWLQCLDGRSGAVEWSVDLLADNGGRTIAHGVCGSPLIDGERVIVAPTGNPKACLVAYNRFDGTRLWQAGHNAASYSSPVIVSLAGRRQLLLHAAVGLEGHDADTGEFLWHFPWSNEFDNNCSQPIVIDGDAGRVLATTGYGQGAVLLDVRADGERWSASPVWTSRDMKTKFTNAVRLDEFVYGLDDGILACIDLETGKRRWKTGRYNHGQILLLDRTLLVQAENGDVALVNLRPERFEELARIPVLNNKTWNHPCVSGRYLLVRNAEEAVCLDCSPPQHMGKSEVATDESTAAANLATAP
ncbi:MAG: PQQ-binding-like beta-propeller repeat protein [Planctomyces sp.]|nr:PQQ-binding-like beta-propeller repeat protein [Planctomyces sp.]